MVHWAGELGYGVREPEPAQSDDESRPEVASESSG